MNPLLVWFCTRYNNTLLFLIIDNCLQYTETNPVVEGQDFVVTYQIFNVGDNTANSIEVLDKYDSLRFVRTLVTLVGLISVPFCSFVSSHNINEEGNIEFTLDELAPGLFL